MVWLLVVALCLAISVLSVLLLRAYKDRDHWKDEWQVAAYKVENLRARGDRWERKARDLDRGAWR